MNRKITLESYQTDGCMLNNEKDITLPKIGRAAIRHHPVCDFVCVLSNSPRCGGLAIMLGAFHSMIHIPHYP
jgi:hypothetical protein